MSDYRKQAVDNLVNRHGSYAAAAAILGIDKSYLWRIGAGQKNPNKKLLRKLGLVKEIHYEWLRPLTGG